MSDHEFGSLQARDVTPIAVLVDEGAVAARLAEAIRFRTISNQDRDDFDEQAFSGFHAWLESTFPLVHARLEREVLGEPRAFSLLYTWPGKDPSLAPVVLMAHQDVVPVVPGTEPQWEHDAYGGDIAEGYVWGRGSLDDKSMVMAVLEAAEMQITAGFEPNRTIYFVFGQDEEVMGREGVQHIVEVLQARGVDEVALVLDEGLPLTVGLFPGITAPMALIGTAEKGYVSLELKVAGPGGHSAMPPKNSNIGILAQAITRLEANPFPYRITPAVRDQMRFVGPELPEATQQILVDIVYGDEPRAGVPDPHLHDEHGHTNCPTAGWHQVPDSTEQFTKYMLSGPQTTAMMHTTTAVTMVSGGVKENVLPPYASAVVNFRILQGDTVASVVEYVTSVVNDDRVQVSALPASIDPSPVSDPYGKEYRLIERSIRQTWDLPDLIVSPYLVIGGADAKYFASTIAKNVYRFTAVRVESAADAARWHGVNERVLVSEYANSIRFFHNLITNTDEL